MRNQDPFSFGADKELLNPYEQSNSPVLAHESPESFDTLAPETTPPRAPAEEYPKQIDYEAAARIFGLGLSIKRMRENMLDNEGGNRG